MSWQVYTPRATRKQAAFTEILAERVGEDLDKVVRQITDGECASIKECTRTQASEVIDYLMWRCKLGG